MTIFLPSADCASEFAGSATAFSAELETKMAERKLSRDPGLTAASVGSSTGERSGEWAVTVGAMCFTVHMPCADHCIVVGGPRIPRGVPWFNVEPRS